MSIADERMVIANTIQRMLDSELEVDAVVTRWVAIAECQADGATIVMHVDGHSLTNQRLDKTEIVGLCQRVMSEDLNA